MKTAAAISSCDGVTPDDMERFNGMYVKPHKTSALREALQQCLGDKPKEEILTILTQLENIPKLPLCLIAAVAAYIKKVKAMPDKSLEAATAEELTSSTDEEFVDAKESPSDDGTKSEDKPSDVGEDDKTSVAGDDDECDDAYKEGIADAIDLTPQISQLQELLESISSERKEQDTMKRELQTLRSEIIKGFAPLQALMQELPKECNRVADLMPSHTLAALEKLTPNPAVAQQQYNSNSLLAQIRGGTLGIKY